MHRWMTNILDGGRVRQICGPRHLCKNWKHQDVFLCSFEYNVFTKMCVAAFFRICTQTTPSVSAFTKASPELSPSPSSCARHLLPLPAASLHLERPDRPKGRLQQSRRTHARHRGQNAESLGISRTQNYSVHCARHYCSVFFFWSTALMFWPK